MGVSLCTPAIRLWPVRALERRTFLHVTEPALNFVLQVKVNHLFEAIPKFWDGGARKWKLPSATHYSPYWV